MVAHPPCIQHTCPSRHRAGYHERRRRARSHDPHRSRDLYSEKWHSTICREHDVVDHVHITRPGRLLMQKCLELGKRACRRSTRGYRHARRWCTWRHRRTWRGRRARRSQPSARTAACPPACAQYDRASAWWEAACHGRFRRVALADSDGTLGGIGAEIHVSGNLRLGGCDAHRASVGGEVQNVRRRRRKHA